MFKLYFKSVRMLFIQDIVNYGLLPLLINLTHFWSMAMVFMFLDDYLERKKILHKYKYQSNIILKEGGINWNKYTQTAYYVLLNQLIINLPISLLMISINKDMDKYSLSLKYLPLQLIGMILTEDLIFYSIHRLIHNKWLYNYIHYWHHEWTVPVALRSQYAHPLEHLCGNVLPIIIIGHLFRLNWVCYNIWFNLATLNALIVHSDYVFFGHGKEHNLHHKYRSGYYGTLGPMDWLCGTKNIKGHKND